MMFWLCCSSWQVDQGSLALYFSGNENVFLTLSKKSALCVRRSCQVFKKFGVFIHESKITIRLKELVTSVGTTRGQEIIRVVVAETFF